MLDRWRPLFKEKELRDGLLHWGSGAAWAKTAENCVDEQFRVGDIFFYAVPSGLRRCTLFRRLCRSLVLFLVARELLQLNLYRAGRLKTLLFHALKIVYRNLFSKKKVDLTASPEFGCRWVAAEGDPILPPLAVLRNERSPQERGRRERDMVEDEEGVDGKGFADKVAVHVVEADRP